MSLIDQSLLNAFKEEQGCVVLTRTRVPDGQGGYKNGWAEGVTFYPSWEYEASPEMTVAEQQGVSRVYRIYVDKSLDLQYHEVFRRISTGQTYRVTNPGTDRHTPASSAMNLRLIEVEIWDLPHEYED